MKTVIEILEELFLPTTKDWRIDNITCDDSTDEIHVYVSYIKPDIVVDGVHYSIYDHRPERIWRHLDLWQYKTIIKARVPRYQVNGKVKSIPVPWASTDARMTYLLEKKMY